MDECSTDEKVWLITTACIDALMGISIMPFIYQLLINPHPTPSVKQIYRVGSTFATLTFISFIISIPRRIFDCNQDDPVASILELMFIIFYAIQIYLLLLLSFMRIVYILKDSPFKLSKNMVKFYHYTFIALPCIVAIFIIGLVMDIAIVMILAAILFFVIIVVLMISIMILFIAKLIKIYKLCNDDDSNMVGLITKNSILTFIFVLGILLMIIFVFVLNTTVNTNSASMDGIGDLVININVYVNLLCVILSFEIFYGYYIKICLCCHNKCSSMCRKCVAKEEGDIKIIEMNSPIHSV